MREKDEKMLRVCGIQRRPHKRFHCYSLHLVLRSGFDVQHVRPAEGLRGNPWRVDRRHSKPAGENAPAGIGENRQPGVPGIPLEPNGSLWQQWQPVLPQWAIGHSLVHPMPCTELVLRSIVGSDCVQGFDARLKLISAFGSAPSFAPSVDASQQQQLHGSSPSSDAATAGLAIPLGL